MTAILQLAGAVTRTDLATYLGRAGRIDDAGVRIQQVGEDAVALWVPVLRPAGLLAASPLVLGVRAIPARIQTDSELDRQGGFVDAVVPLRGMLDRLARTPSDETAAVNIPLPPERLYEAWAGTQPPLTGWQRIASCSAAQLAEIAEAGIAEVAHASGEGLGQLLTERVRTDVWTRLLPRAAFTPVHTGASRAVTSLLPAGAAFAAHALGFLRRQDAGMLSVAPGWYRLAFPAGQILIRRKNADAAE